MVLIQPASADLGPCSNVTVRKFSEICYSSSTTWQGLYAVWPSVPLNITAQAAANSEYIAEVLWLLEGNGTGSQTYLEVGDTAGGGAIGNHRNEWARMWYWVDGSSGSNVQNFIQYSPADSAPRGYEIAWDGVKWLVCADTCPIVVYTWKNPSTFRPTVWVSGGMEINNGGRPLDSSKNSGNFLMQSLLLKYPDGSWAGFPSASTQVDSPCGVAPGCLQGWWNQTPPPYDNFNNGKPQ
jgi:hypothetical protein